MSNHSNRNQQQGEFSLSQGSDGGLPVGARRVGPIARKSRAAKQRSGRRLLAERLESRSLMAVDVNPWHNEFFPMDVDGDVNLSPRDALLVINELNRDGAKALTDSSGTLTADSGAKVDVNGDGFLSPGDALYVINELNGEGEPITVQFGLTTTSLTATTPITSVQVGDHFRLRATVQDLRSMGSGVFAAYMDVAYSSQVQVVIRENQLIQITGNPTSGTFTLTFSGQTTAPITFDPDNALPTVSMVRTALEGLSNIDPGEIEVFNGPNVGTSWSVKFGGKRYGDTNVPNMTGIGAFVGGTAPGVTITELPGSVPVAGENDSIVRSTTYGNNYPNSPSARNGEGANLLVLNEVGGIAGLTPLGTGVQLVYTEEFKAVAAGTGAFASDPAEDSPSHDVLLFGSSVTVSDADIIYPSVNISISQAANAVADTAAATEDQTTNTRINVLLNDTTLNGTKQLQSFTQPAGGVVTRFTNGTTGNLSDDQLDYKPNPNFFGTDTFTYVLSDGAGNTSTATVTVNVAGVNDAPTIAGPSSITTNEDITFAFTGANLISVADIDAGAGNVTVVLAATNGNVAVGGGSASPTMTLTGTVTQLNTALATLTYAPTANVSGSGQVTINVNDNGNTGSGGAKTASKTVAVTITAVNDAPVNNLPAAQTATEGLPLVLSAANGNAISVTDVDAGAATINVQLGVLHGTLNLATTAGLAPLTGNGTASIAMTGTLTAINAALNGLTYNSTALYVGAESLTITTSDLGNTGSGGVKTDTDVLAINVIPNVRPRAVDDTATVNEDSTNNPIDVLINDIDNDGPGPIKATLLSFTNGANGTTARDDNNTPGVLTDDKILYSPNANFSGTDTFTYTINDTAGTGLDSTGTVTVTVTAINDPPQLVDDTRATNEDITLTIAGSSLTSNDSPGAGETMNQTLTVTAVSSTSTKGGSVTLAGGQITYTPPLNYNNDIGGPDTFTYTATDNGTNPANLSGTATVTINITAVNDNPIAGPTQANGVEDNNVTVSFSAITANGSPGGGTDEASQMLSVTAVAGTSSVGGTVANNGTNFVFTPPTDFNGPATITYTLSDDGSPTGSTTGTVTVTLSEVNDAPTANDDMVTAVKNVAKTYSALTLLGNDSRGPANESGQTLRIISVSPTSANGGSVVLNGDGSVTYTPPNNATGADSFTYTMEDNGTTNGQPAPLSDSATVTVDILDYIPMTFSGVVHFDLDNDGVRDATEPGIGGVEVTLAGTDFEGNPVGPLTTTTDRDGRYSFGDISPGHYTITENQPQNTTDGLESVAAPVVIQSNDVLRLHVTVEDNVALPSPNLTGNNFGERGLNSAFAGMTVLLDMLASSDDPGSELHQGMLFSYTDSSADDVAWYRFLRGWDTFLSADLDLAPDRLSAVLTVVTASNQTLQATVTADSARLRVRTDSAGNVMVHVVGDPSDFTLAQAGGGEGERGEGEGPEMNDAILIATRCRTDQSTSAVIQAVDAALASNEIWT